MRVVQDEDLVPIGTFAQAARVTVKALRHYQAVGVLAPAWVDPSSRYRYYRWEQLTDVLCITTLRELDVPLDRIRQHLVGGSPLHEILADERARLERQAARAERALAVIEALGTEQALPDVRVGVVEWRDRAALRAAGTSHADTLGVDAARRIGTLLRHAVELGADPEVPVIGEYPLSLTGSVDYAVFLPVSDDWTGSVDLPGDLTRSSLPGGRLARVVHVGPIETLPLAYHGLVRYLHGGGHQPQGPVFERYLDDPATTPPDQLRTEVLHRLR